MTVTNDNLIKGSCHCGTVQLSFRGAPARLVRCNCSICRRLGASWGHGTSDIITVTAAPDATIAYSHGEKSIAFHSCQTCGCTTHWVSLLDDSPANMAMNMSLAPPKDIADLPVRHFDGADSWTFLD
jgi:hypothetical protein